MRDVWLCCGACFLHNFIQLDRIPDAFAGYSNDGAAAFRKMAKKYGINMIATPVYTSRSNDMSETIRALKASGCTGTVAFAHAADMVELLLESEKQQLEGVFVMGDVLVADYSTILRGLSERHSNPLKILRGVYGIVFGNGRGLPSNNQFAKDWYVSSCNSAHTAFERVGPCYELCVLLLDNKTQIVKRRYAQESTARYSDDGKITWCSDDTDSEGAFMWRKNGSRSGECFGIDFAKASLLRQQGACDMSSADGACPAAELSTFVPYAYDAGIAMAHTLHQLIEVESVDMMDISGRHFLQSLSTHTTFVGATGNVRFQQNHSMGDRKASDVAFYVFNHRGTSMGYEQIVGTIDGGKFKLCDPKGPALAYPCTEYLFPDGSGNIPPDMAPPDPCEPNPCKNDGNCTQNPGHIQQPFNCSCAIDWLGETCEETRYCSMDSKSNQFQPQGMRFENFPRAKTSVAIPFDKLRAEKTESECLPDYRFQGKDDFVLACCSVPGANNTRDRALVQLGDSATNCATYERLLLSDGLLEYGDNFFSCGKRPERFLHLAYNYVAIVLIALIAVLHVGAVLIVIIQRQCVGALDTSQEWVKNEIKDEETCVPGSENDTRKSRVRKDQVADEQTLSKQLRDDAAKQESESESAPVEEVRISVPFATIP